MSINSLDIDSLCRVFKNLRFADRVRLEGVCRLWRCILLRHATNSDISALNVAEFLKTANTDYFQQDSLSFEPTTIGIVERCGSYLQELSLGGRWMKITQAIADAVAENCHRLRVLDLGSVIINCDISPILDVVAENLESFSLEDTSWGDEECANKVTSFFPRMKRLRHLNLKTQLTVVLNELHTITGPVEYLEASTAFRDVKTHSFLTFLENHETLKHLILSPSPVLLDDVMISAIIRLQNLETLVLGYVPTVGYSIEVLGLLHKLKVLSLQEVPCLTEDSLQIILAGLRSLEDLTLRRSRNVYGFSALDHCHSLRSLEIADNPNLVDDDLFSVVDIGLLKKLKLIRCCNLSTEAVTHALQKNQFDTLDLTGSTMMSDEVMYAIASTQRDLKYLSINGCKSISSKGVCAISHMSNIEKLSILDVSNNRQIDDMAVQSLHNALILKKKSKKFDSNHNEVCGGNAKDARTMTSNMLTIYATQSSISDKIDDVVKDSVQILR